MIALHDSEPAALFRATALDPAGHQGGGAA